MENELVAKYSFLPWFRQGLATQITQKDQLGAPAEGVPVKARASFPLNLQVEGDGAAQPAIHKEVFFYGPGDITGIESRAIIKTEPKKGVTNFEYNFFPFIEFYHEDFPWRYTPLAPDGDRLRPWLALIVLKANEFERQAASGVLPSFSLIDGPVSDLFPPAAQSWAWAHVHVNGNLYTLPEDTLDDAISRLEKLIDNTPNLASSRILCPRKLEPNTRYVAFLIPAFERGRLAGLSAPNTAIEDTDIQLASWGHQQDHFSDYSPFQNKWPVYYEWNFQTSGIGEDFETMARKIQPRELDARVGKQWVDIHSPGYKLLFEGGDEQNEGALLMEGALRLPESAEPDLLQMTDEEHPKIAAFVEDLAALVNLEEDLKETELLPDDHKFATNPYFEEDNESIYDDPIITPPLYGRWHTLQNRTNPSEKQQWINQLNLDPRNRIVAGLGAEVIRKNQDSYMDRAWEQFGDLFAVNQYLRRSQFIMKVNDSGFQKHLQPLPPDRLTAVAAGMHQVLKMGGGTRSLKGLINDRDIPNAVMTMSFNKITRPNGAIMRRASVAITQTSENSIFDTYDPHPDDDIHEPPVAIDVKPHPLYILVRSAIGYLERSDGMSWKKPLLNYNGIANTDNFKEALLAFEDYFNQPYWVLKKKKARLNLNTAFKASIIAQINPANSYARRVNSALSVGDKNGQPGENRLVEEILKAPFFTDPMYEEIVNMGADQFVPNLDLVAPNTIALMEINRTYVESFLVGLNYEMARELLWRAFPTDQRGTYFRRFWDFRDNFTAPEQQDITPIHTWLPTSLGLHQDDGHVSNPLVLVLKTDLINRYPDAIIYMEQARRAGGGHENNTKPRKLSGTEQLFPLFQAKVEPDIFFLGFNLTIDDAISDPGWFLVIEERPGEIHFGLDSPEQIESSDNGLTWDDLNWANLSNVVHHIDLDRDIPENPVDDNGISWGANAANMSWILYQKPVRIAIHASAILPH